MQISVGLVQPIGSNLMSCVMKLFCDLTCDQWNSIFTAQTVSWTEKNGQQELQNVQSIYILAGHLSLQAK